MLRVVGAVLLVTGAVVLVILTSVMILQLPFCTPMGAYTYTDYIVPQNGTFTHVSVGSGELQLMPSEGFRYFYRPRLAVDNKLLVYCYGTPHALQSVTVNLTLRRGSVYLFRLSDRALVEPLLSSIPEFVEVLEKRAVAKAQLSEAQPAATVIYPSSVKLYEAVLEVEPGAYYTVVAALMEGEGAQLPPNCTASLQGFVGWLEGSVCKVASPTPAQLVRCLVILALGVLLVDYDLRLEGESITKRISLALGALRRAVVGGGPLKRRGSTS